VTGAEVGLNRQKQTFLQHLFLKNNI